MNEGTTTTFVRPKTVNAQMAAQILGLVRQTVAAWCDEGKIKHTRPGHEYVIPVTEIERVRGVPVTDDELVAVMKARTPPTEKKESST